MPRVTGLHQEADFAESATLISHAAYDLGPVSTRAVSRAPRVPPPRMPGGELALEPPPEPVRVVPAGMLVRLLPVVMVAAAIGFVVVLGVRDPTGWLFAGMIVISTLGMLASGGGRGGAGRRAEADEDRRDYLRYLQQVRRRVRAVAAEQRGAVEWVHPDPAAWPDVLAAGRLWERRPDDPDFGQLRLGRAVQRLATPLIAPQTGPVDGLEPVTALALRRFLRAHAVVPDLPVAIALGGTRRAVLRPATGNLADLEATRSLVRALLAQFVLLHSPRDAVLVVVARRSTWPVWDWVKWLPHALHPRHDDAAGPAGWSRTRWTTYAAGCSRTSWGAGRTPPARACPTC